MRTAHLRALVARRGGGSNAAMPRHGAQLTQSPPRLLPSPSTPQIKQVFGVSGSGGREEL